MARTREISWDFTNRQYATTVAHSETRADNEWQALMECAPGVEPDKSLVELAPLREMIADAIGELDDREQWIFDAIFCRKLSLRQLGAELSLSKTHLARLRDQIREKLRSVLLVQHPNVRSYLNG